MSRTDFYEKLILDAYKILDDDDIGVDWRCEHAQAILARFEEYDDSKCPDCGGGAFLPSVNHKGNSLLLYCPACNRQKTVTHNP